MTDERKEFVFVEYFLCVVMWNFIYYKTNFPLFNKKAQIQTYFINFVIQSDNNYL